MTHDLLRIVPSEIPRPSKYGKSYLAKGDFVYFHYCCDNINDVVSTWNDSDEKRTQILKKKQLILGLGMCLSDTSIDVFMDCKIP